MKKRILSVFLTICMLLTLLPSAVFAAEAEQFTDMPAKSDWSYASLKAAVDHGLLRGIDGKILPGAAVSRAQFAAILGRAFGTTAQADISAYTDTAKGDWYYADMAKAVGMKALAGSGSTLRPEEPITRQETFVALARALKLAPGSASALDGYTDGGKVASWAVEGVAALVGGKYIEGSGGSLNPLGTITRAELAQVMHKLLPAYISAAGTYSEAVAGNLMVNVPGVTLKGITIPGDLVLGDGVGEGDVVLDGVTLQGRLVVRGGGAHSIKIINNSSVGTVVLGKTADGQVRILAERGSRVAVVEIDDGKDDIILEGSFDTVKVDSSTRLVLQDATVTTLTVQAEKAAVALEGKTAVASATVDAKAEGASLTVAKEAQIAKVESAAPKTEIKGDGKVTEAKVSGSDTKITTPNTTVTVDKGTSGVTVGDKVVEGGSTTVNKPTLPAGGGSSGGTVATTRTVKTSDEFYAALVASDCNGIVVDGNMALEEYAMLTKPLTVSAERTLTIYGGLELHGTTLTNKGTVAVNSYLTLGGADAGQAANLVNDGVISVANRAEVELFVGGKMTGTGSLDLAVGTPEARPGYFTLIDLALTDALRLWKPEDVPEGCRTEVSHAILVNNEARMRAAMDALADTEDPESGPFYYCIYLSGNTVAAADLELVPIQRFVIQHGSTLTIPAERKLNIPRGAELRIEGTLDVSAAAEAKNESFYFLASIGTLKGTITDVNGGSHVANYEVKTQEQWDTAAADTSCEFINVNAPGQAINVTDSVERFQINVTAGTLNIVDGAALTMADALEIFPDAAVTVASGGTLNLNGYCNVRGTLTSAGTLALGEDCNLELHGGALAITGGTATKGGNTRVYMENSAFTGTVELDWSGVEISDLYSSAASAHSTLPANVTVRYYDARVTDFTGLKAFQTATNLPALEPDEGGNPRTYEARLVGDVTVSENLTLKRVLYVRADFNWDAEEAVPHTLTVAPGITLTVEKNIFLGVQNGGTMVVNGAVNSSGTLKVEPYFDTDENSADAMNALRARLVNNGTITVQPKHEEQGGEGNNYYPELCVSSGGTLENKGKLEVKGDLRLVVGDEAFNADAATLTTGGILNLSGFCELQNGTLTVTDGNVTNTGEVFVAPGGAMTVTKGVLTNSEGHINLGGGKLAVGADARLVNQGGLDVNYNDGEEVASELTVLGRLSNEQGMSVNGGKMELKTGAEVTNRGGLSFRDGAVLVLADGAKIANNGYVEATDRYSAVDDTVATVTIPENLFTRNSDGEYRRNAQVSTAADLTAALAANPEGATPAEHPAMYWPVIVQGEIAEWVGAIAEGHRVEVRGYNVWDEETQEDVDTPSSLKLNTVTISGDLEVGSGSTVTVAGAVIVASTGNVEIYDTFAKGNDGTLTINATGAPGEENYRMGNVAGIYFLNGEGEVDNGPTVDSFGDETDAKIQHHAIVTSDADLTAALASEDYTVIRLQDNGNGPADLSFPEKAVTLDKEIWVFWTNQLTVPADGALTIAGGHNISLNGGTLQVYGTLTVDEGGWINVIEDANLYVGDISSASKLINNGDILIAEDSLITAMKGAALSGEGWVEGLEYIQNNGATLSGCWLPPSE